jgi:hypothetical protein
MTLLRAALLEFLVCLHLLGAALIFRCLFPRESPWLALFIPTLAVLFALNFIEHFLALPQLGWLLPFTLGGSILTLRRSGPLWDGFRLPYALFVGTFTYILIIRGLHPEIPCWTEASAKKFPRPIAGCLPTTTAATTPSSTTAPRSSSGSSASTSAPATT